MECSKAAEHLARAFISADELAHWREDDSEAKAKENIYDLKESLEAAFKELERVPFEGYQHDMTNLLNQVERKFPLSPYFVNRYAEDLQKAILSQGFLSLIDCECSHKKER